MSNSSAIEDDDVRHKTDDLIRVSPRVGSSRTTQAFEFHADAILANGYDAVTLMRRISLPRTPGRALAGNAVSKPGLI
jgi:hypothetical protein